MPNPNKNSKKSLKDQMEDKKDKPSSVQPARKQGIAINYNQYHRVRDAVSAQMRRKLAGEFPYNMLEREIEVSTSTFWMELVQRAVVDYYEQVRDETTDPQILDSFFNSIGKHPQAWNKFATVEEVIDRFQEFMDN